MPYCGDPATSIRRGWRFTRWSNGPEIPGEVDLRSSIRSPAAGRPRSLGNVDQKYRDPSSHPFGTVRMDGGFDRRVAFTSGNGSVMDLRRRTSDERLSSA